MNKDFVKYIKIVGKNNIKHLLKEELHKKFHLIAIANKKGKLRFMSSPSCSIQLKLATLFKLERAFNLL